jgi:hypothetical protein
MRRQHLGVTAGVLLLIRRAGADSSDPKAEEEAFSQLQGSRMRRILFFTAPPVIQILIKTCATSGALFLQFCTGFYFFNWLMVQALLLLVFFDGANIVTVRQNQRVVADIVRHTVWRCFWAIGNVVEFTAIFLFHVLFFLPVCMESYHHQPPTSETHR